MYTDVPKILPLRAYLYRHPPRSHLWSAHFFLLVPSIAHPPRSHPCHPYPCHLRQGPHHPRRHVCPLRCPNSRHRRLLWLLSLSVFFSFFFFLVSKQPSPAVPLLSGQGCIAGPRHAWVGIYWIAPTLLYTVSVSFPSSLMLHSLILPSSLWLSCAPLIPSKPAP